MLYQHVLPISKKVATIRFFEKRQKTQIAFMNRIKAFL